MTFDKVRQDVQFLLSPAEMRAISQEISLKFSPNATTLLASNEQSFGIAPHAPDTQVKHINTFAIPDSDLVISDQELQAISNNIARDYTPQPSTSVSELVLLPVDPTHIYTYWTLTESNDALATAPLLLRFYWRPDVETKRSSVWFDVAIDPLDANQQVNLPIDNSSYSAAIGYLSSEHQFKALVTSNVASVPVDSSRIKLTVPTPSNVENELTWPSKQPNQPLFTEPGWFIKLHTNQAIGTNARINFELMDRLKANGITVELISEPDLTKHLPVWLAHASGKGL